MKAALYQRHGGPDVIEYVDVPDPEPGPLDVVIDVAACALNRLDVVQRKGWFTVDGFEFPHIAGMDVAGVISAVGDEVSAVNVGDRVVVDPSLVGVAEGSSFAEGTSRDGSVGVIGSSVAGGYAEKCLVPVSHVYRVPDSMPLEHAATFPTAYLTAAHALFEAGQLVAGETVMIHAAGSGVSVAAIQLAVHAGATVLATAGSDGKLDRARGLGAAHVCNNRTTDVAEWAREITDGRGVDMVFDHVGAALFGPSLLAIGAGGRLVSCGNTSGDDAMIPSLGHLFRNAISIHGSGRYRPHEFGRTWQRFCDGDFQVHIDREYPLAEAGAAQERLIGDDVFGKILLRP